MNALLKSVFLPVALLTVVLYGCGKQAERPVFFEASESTQLDSTCSWLAKKEHFYLGDYYDVFNTYYTRQLNQRNYAGAATALETVAETEIYYLSFNGDFLAKVRAFKTLYADRLSWDKVLFADSYLGMYYSEQGEFRKSIRAFRRITVHEPIDYNTCIEIANAYGDMAFCYSSIGDQQRALQLNFKALALFGKTDNLSGSARIYEYIALVHLFTKNYAESEIYFDKALKAYRQAGRTENIFSALYNKMLLYEETGSPRKFELADSAYHLFRDSGVEDPSMEVSLSGFYVEKLLRDNRFAEAKSLLDKMKEDVAGLHSASVDADYYITLAQYEIKTGQGIAGTEVIEKALLAAEEGEHFQNQIAFCLVLKENAALKGDYRKALFYAEKEKTALNQLTNQQMIAKTMELNTRHETEKKEQQIDLQQRTISNGRITIALLIALLAGVILSVIVILSRQKQKKIRSESRKAKLFTRQLLKKTEEERKRIAGDLHDSVSHELLNLKNTIGENGSEAGAKIDAIINDIRIISRNLHPVMFEKVGLAASIEQLVERAQAIHELMVTADIAYDSTLPVADELQIYRIVQEALSNTIKYADAFAAKITVLSRPDGLYIQIKDNGKGFNVADTLSTGSAFGLHNIFERSRAIGGFARIVSDGSGTVITIEIKHTHENTDR